MSISARAVFTTTSLILFVLILVGSGCDKVGEGLTKVVVIEYDQAHNFEEYQFAKYLHTNDPVAGEWLKIRLYDSSKNRRGVWMVYVICSIKNNAPKAEPFNYDVSKFFVEYDGRKHFYRPLAAGTYEGTSPLSGAPGSVISTAVLAPEFRKETQLGPDEEVIPPNADRTVAYRIVIYVSTGIGDPTELPKLNQRLYHDATPMNMVNRNNDTVPLNGIVFGGNLPTVCRPPRKN